MRIVVPFEYDITFVKKGHRNPDKVVAGLTREVDVREVRLADVRLVHQVGAAAQDGKKESAFKEFGGRGARIIEHGGRLYAESCYVGQLEHLMADHEYQTADSPFHVKPRSDVHRFSLMSESSGRAPKLGRPTREQVVASHGELREGTYRDDAGADWARMIDERAAEMLVCDGSVFVPTSEPLLVLAHDLRQARNGAPSRYVPTLTLMEARQGGWSAFELSSDRPVKGDGHVRFRLDEHGRALDALHAFSTKGDDPESSLADTRASSVDLFPAKGEEPEDCVVLARVSSEDLAFGAGADLARWARQLTKCLAKDVMELHPEVAVAYSRLRDAVRSHGKLSSRVIHDRLVDTLSSIAVRGVPGTPSARRAARLALDGGMGPHEASGLISDRFNLGEVGFGFSEFLRGEEAGRSWVRSTGSLEDPTAEGGFVAVEIVSDHEAAMVVDGLGGGPRLGMPTGGALIGIHARDGWSTVPHALVSLGSGMEAVASVGPGGRAAPARLVALAEAHGARVAEARSGLDARSALDALDEAALVF